MILLTLYNRWLVFVNVILARRLFIALFSMNCYLRFVSIVCVVIVIVVCVIIIFIAFLTI